MNVRSVAVLLTALALACILVACSNHGTLEPSAQAQLGVSGKQAPPDINKGVRVVFRTPVATYAQRRGYEDPIVEEVRGNWVRMRFEPTKDLQKEGDTVSTEWVNFDTVNHYYVVK